MAAAAARSKEYEDRFLSPFVAAERSTIDAVIMPNATRKRIADKLAQSAGGKSARAGDAEEQACGDAKQEAR